MLQCPTCGQRVFTTDVVTTTLVQLIGRADGDYTEEPLDMRVGDWGTLACLQCGAETTEQEARQAFQAANPTPGRA